MPIIVENVHLDGIPCQAEIDTWPAEPQTRHEPGCQAGWELCQVLDLRGRPADWLSCKLSDKNIKWAFHDSIDSQLDKMAIQDAEDAAEYRYDAMMDQRMLSHD